MTIFGKNHKEKMWGGGKGEKEFFTGIYASKNPFISVPFGGILNENWCKKDFEKCSPKVFYKSIFIKKNKW